MVGGLTRGLVFFGTSHELDVHFLYISECDISPSVLPAGACVLLEDSDAYLSCLYVARAIV